MKTIYLIRHAKSSWDNSKLRDVERPLNKRGFRDAPMMGALLAKRQKKISLIISSPALRAYTTALFIADALDYPKYEIELNQNIYGASRQTILDIIKQLDNQLESVMIFGHNPTFTELANYYHNKNIDNVPTCGIIEVQAAITDWSKLSLQNAQVINFDYPKKHY